jgi:hypothetical protein
MHDRTEYDLRISEHKRIAKLAATPAQQHSAEISTAAYRRSLATLLLAVAARLDPSLVVNAAKAAPPTPITS